MRFSRQNRGMKIEKDTVVTLQYKVADANGKLIEASKDPMVYLHGGYDNTLPKIEAALQGQEPGYQVMLQLKPQDAFGMRDEKLTRTIAKSEFPPGVKVGGQLEGHTDEGQAHVFHVVKIKGDKVLLDGNHPLAGKELRFSIKVTGVRAATAEEIEHRHVHGAHGHHH
jgi:FKBP-type peptidyl-prolyl cis-trans isomerase SlyD